MNGCTSLAASGIATPKTIPSTPALAIVNNCDGTSTLTASAYDGILIWNTNDVTASITVSQAGTYSVTQTVNGCTSLAASGDAVPNAVLQTPKVTVVDNCDGTSTLTASNYSGDLLWNTGEITPTINVTTPAIYTVVQSMNGCVSSEGSGISETRAEQPSVNLEVTANPVTPGIPVTLTAYPQNGGTSPIYRWIMNNEVIANTESSYTYSPVENDDVYVEMTSNASPCFSGSPVTSNLIHMVISIGTSIDQVGNNAVSIYLTDKNIYVNCTSEAKQIYIYNTLGTLVRTESNISGLKKFDMSHETSQYYLVKVVTQYSVYSEKVLLK